MRRLTARSGRRALSRARAWLLLAGLALLLPLAVTVTSCSVAGWGVGTALTRHDPPQSVPAGRALELHPGTRLGLVMADSSVRRGTFAGRIRLEPVVYRARFEDWRSQSGIALALGDEVELTLRDQRVTRARFAGFGHRAVLLEREGGPGFVELPDRDIRWFGLRDSLGWSGEQLAEADRRGAFPTREAILFRPAPEGTGTDWYNTGDRAWGGTERHLPGSLTVPCDDIDAIEIAGPRTARTVLFVAGLAVDAVIVVASQPTVSMSGSGCAYQSSNAIRVQPGVRLTARAWDTRWGTFGEDDADSGRSPGARTPSSGITH